MATPMVTIVGGSGFVGRHTVKAFAEAGWRINVLCRDTVAAEFLKTSGNVGQVVLQYADITRPETLEGKFTGSDVVVNLVSILYQSGRQKFDAINHRGARLIAELAKKAGAKRLVHISALKADAAVHAKYGLTKTAGEMAVRDVMPQTTILRPSLIIGPEDGFFQRFGRMSMISPFLPVVSGGRTKFQPVIVTDVAAAILAAATRTDALGKTYELVGEKIYSMRELLEMLLRITGRGNVILSLPAPLASVMGFFLELLPFAPAITRDQVQMLKVDNIASDKSLRLKDLGITTTALEAALPDLICRFQSR
ncbi:MAG: complex I NDUFA9 subunit family protein [Alphaproteobacteria bacterium]